MIGVILAAGVGSRLRPITEKKPKCLVKVAGKPLLEYQLDAYRAAGINEVIVIVGYEGGAIRDYLKHVKDMKVLVVENREYEETNNMYSLYLVREHLHGKPFFLNNADLAVDREIILRMAEDKRPDLIAVDKGLYNEESMKLKVNESGQVTDISKQLQKDEAYGCSIDFYKFSRESAEVFMAQVIEIIEQQKNRKEWTELAMSRLLQSGALAMEPLDIGEIRWVEVDNFEDLAIADAVFANAGKRLREIDVYFCDLDGTLYVGDEFIEGASEFVATMRGMGKRIFFLSNNSSKSKAQYVSKLKSMGVSATEEEIILSTDGVISFLVREGVRDVHVLGTNALKQALERAGISVASNKPEYVVVGYDTELTYEKLVEASAYLNRGVDMIATHPDISCPSPQGPVPDCGALQAMLFATTGARPVRIFGKPDPEVLMEALKKIDVPQDRAAIIGDRIYTDIEMAARANITGVLVLSGETTRAEVENASASPDICVKNVRHILDIVGTKE